LNDKLIEIGLKKINREIDLSWRQIAEKFLIINDFGEYDGEKVRDIIKRYRRSVGQISNKTRILCLSDFHYPFNLDKEIFADYRNKVDILVLNGDLLDCHALSKYIKKYRLPFIEELVGARTFFIDLINYIKPKEVVVNYGNHEIRMLSALKADISDEFMALMPKSALSLLFDIGFWEHDHRNKAKTFYEPINKVFKNIDITYTDDWFCRIKDTIFAHPKAFKSGTLKTAEAAYLYFLQSGQPRFKSLILAHTHHQSMGRYGDVFMFEIGCLCEEMDYVAGNLSRPQDKGFIYIVQDGEGNFLYNESKLICL
jgi:predicted phosphodiesterase